MAEICKNPNTDLNFALNNKASLVIPNLDGFVLEVFAFNIPNITLPPATHSMPFTNDKLPGDKLQYGAFSVSFHVLENYKNYKQIFNWMAQIGHQKNLKQYADKKNFREDAYILAKNANYGTTMRVNYIQVWPTKLSSVDFAYNVTTPEPIACTVEFAFHYFELA